MFPENALLIAAIKAGGAIAGAVLALIFMPPKTKSEFVTRTAFSIISGLLFAEPVRFFMKWDPTYEMVIASTALVAMLSWFLMGAIVRIISKWNPPK